MEILLQNKETKEVKTLKESGLVYDGKYLYTVRLGELRSDVTQYYKILKKKGR